MSDAVGIRDLRHNAAAIISAAESGQAFRVTVRGKDTGVVIAKQPSTSPTERRPGITLAQITHAGLHARPTSESFRSAMLEMVEHGRDATGRAGELRG